MAKEISDEEIEQALKEETYMDGQGTFAGYRDLIPLLKVLRYKALKKRLRRSCRPVIKETVAMRKISLGPGWVRQIDENLLPWMQERLAPMDDTGAALSIEEASVIDLYIGEQLINLHLPPGRMVDSHGHRVERQFCASVRLDQLSSKRRDALRCFSDKYDAEYAALFAMDETARKKGILLDFLNNGMLRGTLMVDRPLVWDWDNWRVSKNEGAGDGVIYLHLYPDGTVLLFDAFEGDLLAPEIKVNNADELSELLEQLEKALSSETASEESAIQLNALFNATK